MSPIFRSSDRACSPCLVAIALCLMMVGCGERSPDKQDRVLRAEQANQLARGCARAAEALVHLYDLPAAAKPPAFADELRKAMVEDMEAIDAFFASGSGGAALTDTHTAARLKAVRGELATRIARPLPPPAVPAKTK